MLSNVINSVDHSRFCRFIRDSHFIIFLRRSFDKMRSCYANILDREIHFTEFGDKGTAKHYVVMVHGFVRTCRDFDVAAEFLSTHCGAYVVCPDIIGRGLSQWSPDPENEYNPVFYAALLAELLRHLEIKEQVVYFGTSMGGLVGIIAIGLGLPLAGCIGRLILNDVGPHVNPASVQRIMAYVMTPPVVRRASEMISATTEVYRGFGYNLTADQRWALLQPCIRRLQDGSFSTHWDPAIPKGLKPPPPGTPDLWALYDKITCPTLVVRGEDSDVLLPETLAEMLQRGPKPNSVIIPNAAHAPAFVDEADCKILGAFIGAL